MTKRNEVTLPRIRCRSACTLGAAVLIALAGCQTTGKADAASAASPASNMKSVIAVASVSNQMAAVAWYARCLERAPDVVPAEGVAEWQLAPNAWLQITTDPDHAGHATVIVMVDDLDVQIKACTKGGVVVGEINDYGVVKTVEVVDPDGNRLVFVQEVGPS